MNCVHQTAVPDNEEYLFRFRKKIATERIPASGSIELTHRCNLNCVHCYLGGSRAADGGVPGKELGTGRLLSILDEITEAGCLFLLITGGEPFLRQDFAEIYRHAKGNGLVITVFTNGTLVTDSIIELFEDLPPATVEISLYGATAPTYERITRSHGTYEKCMSGIKRLIDRKIDVRLKTILMTLNSGEFYEIKKIAEGYGVKFRFDPAISPRLNGDRSPLRLRVPAGEAVEKEFSDPTIAASWLSYLGKYPGSPVTDTLYTCGAGVTNFHIDPYGYLRPCLMAAAPRYNLSTGSFSEGWLSVMPAVREVKAPREYRCNKCEERDICGFCPPSFGLESGEVPGYSQYHCDMSRQRSIILRRSGNPRRRTEDHGKKQDKREL